MSGLRDLYERSTPTIRIRITPPGGKGPERVDLEDLEIDELLARRMGLGGHMIGKTISRVLSMTYEDTEKGADKATIKLNNYDLRFPDDPIFDNGNSLFLTWGYVGTMAPEREMTITSWTPGPTFTVECQFKAAVKANQTPADKTFYGKSYAEIAELLAEQNGFGTASRFIEPVPFRPESVVQDNLTDAQFMKKLAKEIGYIFFIDASGWHFHPQAVGQQPRKVLKYFDDSGRGELLEFPSFEKAPAAQPGKVTTKAIDPVTKKPIVAEGSNATTAGRKGLAKNLEVIDRRTAQTSLRPLAAKEAVTTTTATSPAEAKAKAQGLYKKASMTPSKCTAKGVGDPNFTAKSVLELQQIGIRLSGLYYCPSCTHTVETGSFIIAYKLQRDGTNGAGPGAAQTTAKTNDQKAPVAGPGGAPKLESFEKINRVTAQTSTAFRPPGPKK